MLHVELINRIIEAEHKAREMADTAKAKRLSLKSDLQGAAEEIRGSYYQRAVRRIEEVREKERLICDEQIRQLDNHYVQELSHMEGKFAEHRSEWVNKLFALTVMR